MPKRAKRLRNQSRELSEQSTRLCSESEKVMLRAKELIWKGKKFLPSNTVLVVDHNSPTLISLAKHLGAAPERDVLMAHSESGAIDMARQHQPDWAIVVSSMVVTGGRQLLYELIKEVSPNTKIMIATDTQAATVPIKPEKPPKEEPYFVIPRGTRKKQPPSPLSPVKP